MIPKIDKLKKDNYHYQYGYRYAVTSNKECDLVHTFNDAIRYWLWHCGIPAKYCFKKINYGKNI